MVLHVFTAGVALSGRDARTLIIPLQYSLNPCNQLIEALSLRKVSYETQTRLYNAVVIATH